MVTIVSQPRTDSIAESIDPIAGLLASLEARYRAKRLLNDSVPSVCSVLERAEARDTRCMLSAMTVTHRSVPDVEGSWGVVGGWKQNGTCRRILRREWLLGT